MGTIPSYPPAVQPLSPDDLIPVWQGGAQKTSTVEDLLNSNASGGLALATLQYPATALQAIFAGAFVHVGYSGGFTVDLAWAANPALWANAFAIADVSLGDTGILQSIGLNSAVTITVGAAQVWLSDTVPGGYQTTPPTAGGSIVQPLSLAPAAPGHGILFTPLPWIGPL